VRFTSRVLVKAQERTDRKISQAGQRRRVTAIIPVNRIAALSHATPLPWHTLSLSLALAYTGRKYVRTRDIRWAAWLGIREVKDAGLVQPALFVIQTPWNGSTLTSLASSVVQQVAARTDYIITLNRLTKRGRITGTRQTTISAFYLPVLAKEVALGLAGAWLREITLTCVTAALIAIWPVRADGLRARNSQAGRTGTEHIRASVPIYTAHWLAIVAVDLIERRTHQVLTPTAGATHIARHTLGALIGKA
jgi:hypothetical protein